MKLLKVSVPNFRNLKNVELTFEPSLKPAVFPIGSENGGGKSTLLQLIFVLLTCSLDDDKTEFLENLLKSLKLSDIFNRKNNPEFYHIADITIIYENTELEFSFFLIIKDPIISITDNDDFFKDLLETSMKFKDYQDIVKRKNNFTYELKLKQNKKQELKNKISHIERNIINEWIPEGEEDKAKKELKDTEEKIEILVKEILQLNREINNINQTIKQHETENNKNKSKLLSQSMLALKVVNLFNNLQSAFCCETTRNDHDLALEALNFVSKHIYLAVPPTQPYLFLNKSIKKLILSNLSSYYSGITTKTLPNSYIHNQLAITEILNAFKQARDKDWKNKRTPFKEKDLSINEYDKLVEEFHQFIGDDKYIIPSQDMNSITICRKTLENKFIELEPEELSHGELKRLGLYAWIKYNNINDSIILIDEIENGLHPDWQYNIVNELASWGDNQYLLATHSFYLCEALTPGHVKEIEPKMLNPNSEE